MSLARVYITGASSGIGAALAQTVPFAADVIDISRSGPQDPSIRHLQADLSTPAGLAAIGQALEDELAGFTGPRVCLIQSAGTIEPIGFAGTVDDQAYHTNVMLNGPAPQVLGHRFLRAVAGLDARRELVSITSGAASTVYPGWSSYGAGKAAVDQWTRTVGAEQARSPAPVTVCAIAPGVVDTAMQDRIRGMDEQQFPLADRFRTLHAEGRLASPQEVARRLWQVLERGLETGAVLDLREL